MECRCISDLTVHSGGYAVHEFHKGEQYQYKIEEHEEGVWFYSISDGFSMTEYPMLPDYFKRYFNNVQQIREDKLNQLLNQK